MKIFQDENGRWTYQDSCGISIIQIEASRLPELINRCKTETGRGVWLIYLAINSKNNAKIGRSQNLDQRIKNINGHIAKKIGGSLYMRWSFSSGIFSEGVMLASFAHRKIADTNECFALSRKDIEWFESVKGIDEEKLYGLILNNGRVFNRRIRHGKIAEVPCTVETRKSPYDGREYWHTVDAG